MHEVQSLRSCVYILPVILRVTARVAECLFPFLQRFTEAVSCQRIQKGPNTDLSACICAPRRILNTQVFYHHKGRMSRKQAVYPATNCPSKGKKSEKKVKLAERASSHTCKMCKKGRVDARRQVCPLAAYRMGSVYLFHAKRVTIHTLPRASELCAGDAKPRTRYNLP